MNDEELRQLFAQEAATRLDRLAHQLLELEDAGVDPEVVASTFRDAHTLKGSAAIVDLPAVAHLAHAMEDVLEPLRAGTGSVTRGLIDSLLAAVDGLRTALPALLAGEDRTEQLGQLASAVRLAVSAGAAPIAASVDGSVTPPAERGSIPPVGRTSITTPAASTNVVRVPVERLDELVRLVGEATAAGLRVRRAVGDRLGAEAAADMIELHELSRSLHDLQNRTMRARMVPVATLVEPLRRAVRDAARQLGKAASFELRGGETELDRGVLDHLGDPLLHLVRNAVAHGIEPPAGRSAAGKVETGRVTVHAMQLGSDVIIAVSDDGGGIDVEAVKADAARRGFATDVLSDADAIELAFRAGVSTVRSVTEVAGRGVGLDVVREKVSAVRGRVEVDSTAGAGTEFRVIVPITLAVLACLLLESGGQTMALPLHAVSQVVSGGSPRTVVEGRPAVWIDEAPVPLSDLAAILGRTPSRGGPAVVIRSLSGRHAFEVDSLVADRDVVVSALPTHLPRLPVVAGVSLEPDGSIIPVLDPVGLVTRSRDHAAGRQPERMDMPTEDRHGAAILVVDDALAVRELQRTILERSGYRVRTAADGRDALAKLSEEPADLVLTDLEMPNLDGFGLTESIRANPALRNIGVVILTSRAGEEDRRLGLEAGADAYIVKSSFDESALLAVVARVLGQER